MNKYQVVFTYHKAKTALTIEYDAASDREALEEALLDLDIQKQYKEYKNLNLKQITIHRIK